MSEKSDGFRKALYNALTRWCYNVDVDVLRSANTFHTFTFFTLAYILFVWLGSQWQLGHDLFGLDFWSTISFWFPGLTAGVWISFRLRDPKISPVAAWWGDIVSSALTFFFLAALVVLCRYKSVGIPGSFLIVAGCGLGWLYQLEWKSPYLAIACFITGLAATCFARSPENNVALLAFLPFSLTGMLFFGAIASKIATLQLERRRYQGYVQELQRTAPIFSANVSPSQPFKKEFEVCQNSGQRILIVLVATKMFLEKRLLGENQKKLIEGIQDAIQICGTNVAKARKLQSQPQQSTNLQRTVGIPLVVTLKEVVQEATPKTNPYLFRLQTIDDISVGIIGGVHTLTRILHAVLLNAIEGDGKQGASAIEVQTLRTFDGKQIQLLVQDDGPGFRGRPSDWIEPFKTTKEHETAGMGLSIVERLIVASGGSLALTNNRHGALVTLTFPISGKGNNHEQSS